MSADLSSLRISKDKREDNNHSKNRFFYLGGGIIVILLAVLFLFFAYSGSSPQVELVTAVLQTPSESSAVLSASGYVVAQRKASVASKATGRLAYLGVVEGDKVRKNQIIAKLENNDIEAQLNESKANLKLTQAVLNEAKKDFGRQKALFESGSISQSELDASESRFKQAEASYELAQAKVNEMEIALENTYIRAPFDGTVLTKNADIGEIVAPLGAGSNTKAAVVTIADMNSLQVEADVSESNIQKIKLKQDCQVTLDAYPGRYYQGFVAKIIPTADRSKGTVTVKIGFKKYDSSVLPEMSAKVIFLADSDAQSNENLKPVLMIPYSSLRKQNDQNLVFFVKDGNAAASKVTTGRTFGNYVEILSGLKEGDQIIANLNNEIKDGTKVKIK